jgi:hypothetical protein
MAKKKAKKTVKKEAVAKKKATLRRSSMRPPAPKRLLREGPRPVDPDLSEKATKTRSPSLSGDDPTKYPRRSLKSRRPGNPSR